MKKFPKNNRQYEEELLLTIEQITKKFIEARRLAKLERKLQNHNKSTY